MVKKIKGGMVRRRLGLLLFPFLFLLSPNLNGQEDSLMRVLVLDSVEKNYPANPFLQVWEETETDLSPEEVMERKTDLPFLQLDSQYVASRHDHVLWVRLKVKNPLQEAAEWVILDRVGNNYIDLYQPQPDSPWVHRRAGAYVPGRERDLVKYNLVGISLPLASEEEANFILRIHNIDHSNPEIDLLVMPRKTWNTISREGTLVFVGSFLSILGIMFFYSLMVFIGTKESAYLFYSLYLASIAFFLLFAGGPHQLRFAPVLNNYFMFTALSGISIFYFQFGRTFLNTPELIPKWDLWIRRYILLRMLLLLVQLGILGVSYQVETVIAIEFSFFLVDAFMSLALYIVLIQTRSTLAWFFIAGSALVFVFALTYIGIAVVILKTDPNFQWFFLAVVAEIMAFSLGLGYRMRKMEWEKLEAQQQQLAAQESLNEELSKINTIFGRFVPHEFLQSLGYDNILDIRLGDAVERDVAVMFSDIRDFTALSEQMTPTENFHFLNSYLGRMGPAISHHKGFVNQYFGDGIMAIFMEGPQGGLQSALDMLATLKRYNQYRLEKGRKTIRIGIGLHRGPLVMGIIGDTLRMEPNVVSDTVNTAARLEGLTKHFDATLLVSSSVLEELEKPDNFRYRFLGNIQVKGKKEPLGVYDFFEGDPDDIILLKEKSKPDFEAGLAYYYKREFVLAARAFDQALAHYPEDLPTRNYHRHAIRYLAEGVPEDWTGVELMLKK